MSHYPAQASLLEVGRGGIGDRLAGLTHSLTRFALVGWMWHKEWRRWGTQGCPVLLLLCAWLWRCAALALALGQVLVVM